MPSSNSYSSSMSTNHPSFWSDLGRVVYRVAALMTPANARSTTTFALAQTTSNLPRGICT